MRKFFTHKLVVKVLDWMKAFLIAFVVILCVRGLLLEPFTIPSPSMERSLLTGDFILVNKLSYGPRIIQTPLSFPFVDKKWYSEWFTFSYHRLFGTPDVERNDVIVFNYPMEEEFPVDHRTTFIKRCVGLPGDSIGIIDAKVFINGKVLQEMPEIQHNYTIESTSKLDSAFMAQYDITEGGLISEKGDYSFSLTRNNAAKLKTLKEIKSISMNCEKNEMWDETVFPYKIGYPWNVDNFGVLYIPKKGDTLQLDTSKINLYSRLISVYEKNTLRISGDSVFINDSLAKHYVVKMNYYFVMGDNRHNSMDSRYWGFLPEDHIIGKAWIIFYSYNKSEEHSRWDRCFKKIK